MSNEISTSNQEPMVIVLSADSKYSPMLATCLSTILETHTKKDLRLIVLDLGVQEKYRAICERLMRDDANAKNRSATLEYIDMKDISEELEHDPDAPRQFPLSSYARLFIDRVLDVDKALYLDCDALVLDSLEDVWNKPLGGGSLRRHRISRQLRISRRALSKIGRSLYQCRFFACQLQSVTCS